MSGRFAIVSYSGLFPDALDENIFFENLIQGSVSIKDLRKEEYTSSAQLNLAPHYSEDTSTINKAHSFYGSFLDRTYIDTLAKKLNLDRSTHTSAEIICHELISRIFQSIPEKRLIGKKELIIAPSFSSPDLIRIQIQKALKSYPDISNSIHVQNYCSQLQLSKYRQTPLKKDEIQRLAFESLRHKFNIDGPCILTEAACASSLSAIYIGINRLSSGLSDISIVAGVGLDLNLFSMIGFSKTGILSKDTLTPFSEGSSGTNPGEGAAAFLIMREEDALLSKLPIKAVIVGCDGSSDGASGGLVEPTEKGQILAYERSYKHLSDRSVSYIEAHGTGTSLGDRTELASIRSFFGSGHVLGTVKANIGHAIFAAGSASLVKCLKILETDIIPPQPIKNKMKEAADFIIPTLDDPLLKFDSLKNKSKTPRIGISSFGFGGSNFHMVLEKPSLSPMIQIPSKKISRVVVCAELEFDFESVDSLFNPMAHKIPPIVLPQMDKAILAGLLAVETLIKKNSLRLTEAAKTEIGVVSAVDSYLNKASEWIELCSFLDIARHSQDIHSISKEQELNITEDSIPGCLANMISGKVTKSFDFKGPNFSINDESLSHGSAIESIYAILKNRSAAFFVISISQKSSMDIPVQSPKKVMCTLVSELNFAIKNEFPILSEIVGSERTNSNNSIKKDSNSYDELPI